MPPSMLKIRFWTRKLVFNHTIIVNFNWDVLWRFLVASDKHELSMFLLSRKSNQNVLLVSRDVAEDRIKLISDHVFRLHCNAHLCRNRNHKTMKMKNKNYKIARLLKKTRQNQTALTNWTLISEKNIMNIIPYHKYQIFT